MTTKPSFPICNNSKHLFCSDEVAQMRAYVASRTTDEILRAEITQTEIVCSTTYGFVSFNLIDIFVP